MKIDAHQHFWKYNLSEYSWISDKMDLLKRDFLPDGLAFEMECAGFEGSIAVQARQTLEETRWLLELAGRHDFIKGVVGWIDLLSEKRDELLMDLAQNKKLKGIRHVIQDEPDDRFMVSDSFMKGIELLGRHKLVYDILIYPRHLDYAEELVSAFPEQRFVLDHIGKPLIREGILSPWIDRIQKLAVHPNVCCKLSGMVTEARVPGWTTHDFRPYLDIVFNAFGLSRLMIGSDWPVCTLAASYFNTMQIVIDYMQPLSNPDKGMVLGNNAIQIYNLEI